MGRKYSELYIVVSSAGRLYIGQSSSPSKTRALDQRVHKPSQSFACSFMSCVTMPPSQRNHVTSAAPRENNAASWMYSTVLSISHTFVEEEKDILQRFSYTFCSSHSDTGPLALVLCKPVG